ncbi:MAG: NYN domain-containing protein [Candidatus Andersenbacteria bacterium]|nr:NYN domain-containing protein [Candidatus Andersenbacteria bacterium]
MIKKTKKSSSELSFERKSLKHKDQRIGVFVDAQNMYHSARNLYKARVNFKEVLNVAVSDRVLIRAITYVIRTESGEEKSFFEAMEKLGFEIKEKDLQIFAGGQKKADWDVGLAVDAIKLADKLDVVVIVSGDGDYEPLVEYLKINKGCRVETVAFGESASAKLIEIADEFTDLSKDKKRFLIK